MILSQANENAVRKMKVWNLEMLTLATHILLLSTVTLQWTYISDSFIYHVTTYHQLIKKLNDFVRGGLL